MPSPDAKLLASAIATAPTETLASLLAMIEEVSLTTMLAGRISDRFNKQEAGAHFAAKLANRAAQFANQPRSALLLLLYAGMNRIAGIAPRRYAAPDDFTDNAEDILHALYGFIRKQAPKADVCSLTGLVQYQAGLLFDQMQEQFADMPTDKQTRFIEQLKGHVQSLPEEQQQFLLNRLRAHELSTEVLRKALISGSLGGAFATTVGIGGFPVYMGASSLLAGMAGLVGLTLPFGMYTALSAAISVVASPLFLLAALGGGGFMLVSGKNRDMRERLLPMVVTNVVVAALCLDDKHENQSEQAVELWQQDWQQVCICREQLQQQKLILADAEKALAETRSELKTIRRTDHQLQSDRSSIIGAVAHAALDKAEQIAAGDWGDAAKPFGQQLLEIGQSLDALRQQPHGSGLLTRIKEGLTVLGDTASLKLKRLQLAQECAKTVCSRWESTSNRPTAPDMQEKAEALSELHERLETVGGAIAELELREQQQQQERTRLMALVADLQLKTRDAEKAQWGMEKLQ